jgi:hypothetical protein
MDLEVFDGDGKVLIESEDEDKGWSSQRER